MGNCRAVAGPFVEALVGRCGTVGETIGRTVGGTVGRTVGRTAVEPR